MGSSLNWGPFLGPVIVRHNYEKGPKRDPSLENYPYRIRVSLKSEGSWSGPGVEGFRV